MLKKKGLFVDVFASHQKQNSEDFSKFKIPSLIFHLPVFMSESL